MERRAGVQAAQLGPQIMLLQGWGKLSFWECGAPAVLSVTGC